jgi:hypothetical protein
VEWLKVKALSSSPSTAKKKKKKKKEKKRKKGKYFEGKWLDLGTFIQPLGQRGGQ